MFKITVYINSSIMDDKPLRRNAQRLQQYEGYYLYSIIYENAEFILTFIIQMSYSLFTALIIIDMDLLYAFAYRSFIISRYCTNLPFSDIPLGVVL